MRKLLISLATIVGCCFPTAALAKQPELTRQEIQQITREAYMRTYEARQCVDYSAFERYEQAMGFCFSWYVQALDDKEKAAAGFWYSGTSAAIQNGIANERD